MKDAGKSNLYQMLLHLMIPPKPIKSTSSVLISALFGSGPFGGPM